MIRKIEERGSERRVIKPHKQSVALVRGRRTSGKGKRGRRPIPMLRQRIIHSATELFGEKGFDQVLTDEVALRAGVGKGSVYRQFGSKEQLYAAAVIEGFTQLRSQIEAALANAKSDRERLTTIVSQTMTYFWNRRHFFILLRDPAKLPRAQEHRYFTERGQLARLVSGVLRDAGRGGRIRTDLDFDLLAECLLGMIRGVQRFKRDSTRLDEAVHTIVSLFLNGCVGG
jgi:AcrR family transcriptional regulator